MTSLERALQLARSGRKVLANPPGVVPEIPQCLRLKRPGSWRR